jgi:hypothetical protein
MNIDNRVISRVACVLLPVIAAAPAGAWVHAGGGGSYGSASTAHYGNTSYGAASTTHTGANGGSETKTATGSVTTNPNGSKSYSGGEQTTYKAPDGQTATTDKTTNGVAYNGQTTAYHTNTASTSNGAYYGSSHTTYGTTYGTTAYHSTYYGTTAYPAYHPPTTVNYYGSSCYNCGGWSSAGAAAAGLAVGVVAGAAVASANTAAATNNAYAAGVATGSANTAAAYNAGVAVGASAVFPVGTIYATLPVGAITTTVQGQTYYLQGNTWFLPSYGANGVYYRVVVAP